LRDAKQVRILATRPIGSSGGGVDHLGSPSLALQIVPVSFHCRPDCVKTAGFKMEYGCVSVQRAVDGSLRGRNFIQQLKEEILRRY